MLPITLITTQSYHKPKWHEVNVTLTLIMTQSYHKPKLHEVDVTFNPNHDTKLS
jgi:hypothetical protein